MVSVIIINFQSQDFILNCLKTMLLHHSEQQLEVIIVNNGGDLAEVMQGFPSVKIVHSEKNLGFSAANNLGFSHANGDVILYLNPDTYFISEVIHSCAEKLRNGPEIGLLGCRLLNEDRSLQISYHDGDKVFWKLLYRNPIMIKFFGGSKRASRSMEKIVAMHASDHQANWLTGAFAMMRRQDIIERRLHWDEDFFMYWEDVELCYRVRKSGLTCQYTTAVQLVHIGGSGENPTTSRFNMLEKSKLLFIEKVNGRLLKKIYFSMMKCELRVELMMERKKDKLATCLQNEMNFYGISKKS